MGRTLESRVGHRRWCATLCTILSADLRKRHKERFNPHRARFLPPLVFTPALLAPCLRTVGATARTPLSRGLARSLSRPLYMGPTDTFACSTTGMHRSPRCGLATRSPSSLVQGFPHLECLVVLEYSLTRGDALGFPRSRLSRRLGPTTTPSSTKRRLSPAHRKS